MDYPKSLTDSFKAVDINSFEIKDFSSFYSFIYEILYIRRNLTQKYNENIRIYVHTKHTQYILYLINMNAIKLVIKINNITRNIMLKLYSYKMCCMRQFTILNYYYNSFPNFMFMLVLKPNEINSKNKKHPHVYTNAVI